MNPIHSLAIDGWEYRAIGSLAVSSLIALALRLLLRCSRFRAALPPAARYWIWWIVCLRFAAAFLPAPSVSVAVPPHAAGWLTIPAHRVLLGLPIAHDKLKSRATKSHLAPSATAATTPAPKNAFTAPARAFTSAAAPAPVPKPMPPLVQRISFETIPLAVWAIGAALRLTASIVATRKVRAHLRNAQVVDDPVALQLLADIHQVPNPPPHLLHHPDASSPLVTLWKRRAAILLPDWLLSEPPDVLQTVLSHEARHLRRRDPWLAIVPWLCCAIFWWLPAATLASAECARCAEEDCDLAAVGNAAPADRRRYAELLIRIAAPRRSATTPLGASRFSAGYKTLRQRLLAIQSTSQSAPKASPGWPAALTAACLCAAAIAVPSLTLSLAKAASLIDAALPKSAPLYQLIDLGTPSETGSAAESIGSSGDVVGYEILPGHPGLRGFAWRDGQSRLLPPALGFKSSRVVAVNARGDIALSAFGLMKYQHAAIVTQDGAVTPLPTPQPYRYATAMALNDADAAAGYAYSGRAYGRLKARAVVWNQGKIIDLGTLGGPCSEALGLNAQGDIVGKADLPQGVTHAFIAPASARLADLGALTQTSNSAAYAVNKNSEIVGYSSTDNSSLQHAVLWPGNSSPPIDLGGLRPGGISKARSINDQGDIVGVSATAGGSHASATLWRNGRIYDLNAQLAAPPPGWVLRYAVGINNAGQIVGVGQKNGQTRAFLLQPVNAAVH